MSQVQLLEQLLVQQLLVQQLPQLPLPPQTKMSRRMIIIQKQPLLLFPQNILFTLSPRNDFKEPARPARGTGA